MKKIHLCLVSIVLLSQVAIAQTKPAQLAQLDIALKHNDQREQQTLRQLHRLLSAYDLSGWLFTRKIVIDSGFDTIPHSHPILTLNTRHLKDDELLLATFVHEQLHWYADERPKELEAAYQELKSLFPHAPVGFPQGGNDEEWTYKHILVCYLEYQAIKRLLGELKAKQVMQFWTTDHYTWIYKTILEREREIGDLMRKHKLIPLRQTSAPAAEAQRKAIHQLRIYEIFESNKKAFHDRFRDHAMRIMARYDFKIIAMWEAKKGERTEFVYLLEWPDRETMKDRWAKFMADQEWANIKKETGQKHGPLVGEIEDRTLETTDYSPRKSFGSNPENR